MAKKKAATLPPKLTEIEQDLLSHIQDGYQLETDSLGGNPVLRRLKDNEEIRPLSANRNTIKAMERRGLISPGKGRPAHYRVASQKESKLVQPLLETGSVLASVASLRNSSLSRVYNDAVRDLKDRVALVTGGSRGIGAAVAITLAKAGADGVLRHDLRKSV